MSLSFKSFSRGFIGPIGDDLPSIIVILLGLSLFFSGLSFTLNTYNHKLDSFNTLKGGMEIANKVNENAIIKSSIHVSDLVHSAEKIADSYGLSFCVKKTVGASSSEECYSLASSLHDCDVGWVHYSFLTAFETSSGIKLGNLEVCAG